MQNSPRASRRSTSVDSSLGSVQHVSIGRLVYPRRGSYAGWNGRICRIAGDHKIRCCGAILGPTKRPALVAVPLLTCAPSPSSTEDKARFETSRKRIDAALHVTGQMEFELGHAGMAILAVTKISRGAVRQDEVAPGTSLYVFPPSGALSVTLNTLTPWRKEHWHRNQNTALEGR